MAERWTPQEAREWVRLGGDLICYLLAAFMVVFGTLNAVEFGVTILAAIFATAMAFLGVPATLRLDRRNQSGE